MNITRLSLALVLLPLAAQTAPLPEAIQQAVREVARWDYSQPRKAAFLLEQFVPKATADPQQRQELATLLVQSITAAGTTSLGRTILCQHLALVAGEAEAPALQKLSENPASASDARIALGTLGGYAVGAPAPAEPKEQYLAQTADPKAASRVAALASLARFHPGAAMPALRQALHDPIQIVSTTAIQQIGRLDGATLAAELFKLSPPQQVLALEVITQHKVTAARSGVVDLAGSSDPSIRLAAIAALGEMGDAGTVPLLATLAAAGSAEVQAAVENALAGLSAPGVDEAILREVSAAPPAGRPTMINAAAQRASSGVLPLLLAAASDPNAAVQSAALKGLAKLGEPALYGPLVELLASLQNPLLESAVAAVGRRVETAPARVAPLVAMLARKDLPEAAQAAVLRTLALTGGPEALQAVRERLATQDAAVRALADWPQPEALEDLHKVASQSQNTLHRTLALRGLLRLATKSNQPLPWMQRARPLLKTAADKRLWLGALSELNDPAALVLAEEMTSDTEVAAEARLAADKINVALGGKSKYAGARRTALAKTSPAGANLVAYLDCGAEARDREGSLRLHVTRGNNWTFHGEGDPIALTVAFAGGEVNFEAEGFDPKKCYTLGFTWWDGDGNGRAQSTWAGGQQLLEKTALPASPRGPASFTRPIPAAAIRDGKLRIAFKAEAKSNCVVSELWLIESDKPLPAASTSAAPVPVAAVPGPVPGPVVKANPGAAKKVLIVTGVELHNWRETVPLLTSAIATDTRLEVSVIEDPRYLASPNLEKYDTFVLNYQNHQVASPDGALANLKKAVEGGKGLVLVHFACGAFIDWQTRTVDKDFLPIAGRVWNPKLRGHDPRGPFQVKITDAEHAITKGLTGFETEDELYTCLDGDVPVQLLAVATSKVDHKDYPMAFLLLPGKGRTFHCALGHHAAAFCPPVRQLYQRGTAWTCGLEP